MPVYAYECEKCDKEFDLTRPMSEYKDPGHCPDCRNIGKKLVTKPYGFIGAKVENAEYNPGLGCIVKNKQHREEICKRKNLVEIGNENPNTIHKTFDTQREQKRKKTWDDLL